MDEPPIQDKRTWVWRSYPGTTDAGIFSVLAAIEVVAAIAAYWGYAIWAHTQVHLLISILVAPLLLLRSEQSVELGIRWFKRFDIIPNEIDLFESDSEILRAIKTPFYVLFLLVRGLVLALLIRVAATACHPFAGIGSLSRNWWRTIFSTDIFTKPEIIPGHSVEGSVFQFEELFYRLNYIILMASENGIENKIHRLVMGIGAWGIFILSLGPAYIYRMSVKSTAWVHWPLLYVARPLIYSDPDEVRIRLWHDFREWLRRGLAFLTVVGAVVASSQSFMK